MTGVSPITGGVHVADVKGLDLETAMMVIQSQRAELLETQLKGQLEEIQKRNASIANLNNLLGHLKGMRPSGTNPDATANVGGDEKTTNDALKMMREAGLGPPTVPNDQVSELSHMETKSITLPFFNHKHTWQEKVIDRAAYTPTLKQADFDKYVEQLKGKIDSLNSSQQMDMLRMQSLTNKRNEAFDLMTNFIKKMSDSKSSVIGNMR